MANDNGSDRRQRRELEEIRRKFTEVGARLVPAFEPATPADQQPPPSGPLPAAPRLQQSARPGWQRLAALALIFVLGTGLGYLLPRADAQPAPPAPSAPQPSATTAAPQASTPPAAAAAVARSCLETARRGDAVIHLLVTNVRDRRLAQALKAYTIASQACREEASP